MSLNSGSGPSDLDLSTLTDSEKRELQQFVSNESQKASIQESVHHLTGMCFKKCVGSKISVGTLDKYEEPCMQNCVHRFMDANMTVLKHLEKMRTQ